MSDQLVGWLGQVDAVLTAATPVVKHLREFLGELGGFGFSSYGVVCALRRFLFESKEPRRVTKIGKRRGLRRPRPNNQP